MLFALVLTRGFLICRIYYKKIVRFDKFSAKFAQILNSIFFLKSTWLWIINILKFFFLPKIFTIESKFITLVPLFGGNFWCFFCFGFGCFLLFFDYNFYEFYNSQRIFRYNLTSLVPSLVKNIKKCIKMENRWLVLLLIFKYCFYVRYF